MSKIYIEQYINGLYANGLQTLRPVDFSSAPSVALPSGTTINGAAATPSAVISNSANAFSVGPTTPATTNPAFNVDASTASMVAGVNVKGAATGGTVAIAAIDSGSNTSLTVDGKGTGTIGINTVSTTSGLVTIGNSTSLAGVVVNGPTNITSASATSLTVGPNGTTTPILAVASNTASAVAGLKITGAATGGTVAVVVTDSGSNTNLTIDGKGTGTIGIGTVSTGVVTVGSVSGVSVTLGQVSNAPTFIAGTGVTAGGVVGLALGSTFIKVCVGSGAPTLSAAQGSIYLRSDGSSTSTRLYVNTTGSTTWTNVTTAT